MLLVTVPSVEAFDESASEFVTIPGGMLALEHSLSSLSKWEQIHKKPFLGKEAKTREETLDYIKVMNTAPVSSPEVYNNLTSENFKEISDYLDDKMTATWFAETPNARTNGEIITAEIIYYWMTALQVPSEYEYWHLNRLLTLIKVINLKNAPAKKMGKQDAATMQRTLNEQRRAQTGSSG